MPYRIHSIYQSMQIIIEGLILAVATCYGFASATLDVSVDWWGRISGQHGALFAMTVAVVVLWFSWQSDRKTKAKMEADRRRHEDDLRENERQERERRDKYEDEQRDRRHNEMMVMQSKNSSDLQKLTVDGITAQIKLVGVVKDMSKEIENLRKEMSKDIEVLTNAISTKPCGEDLPRRERRTETQ